MGAVNGGARDSDAKYDVRETFTAARTLVSVDQLAVAMVIEKYPPFVGGAERQAQMLAGFVSARVDRCDVFTAQPPDPSPGAVDSPRRLGTTRREGPRHAVNFASALSHFLARGRRYAVVHGYALSGMVCGAVLAARLSGRPFVVKICSLGDNGDIAKLRRAAIGRAIWPFLRRAGTFVVPSPALVADVMRTGVPARSIAAIPNIAAPVPDGAPPQAAARASLGLPDRPTALFLGRLVPGKGLDVLPQAWDDVAARLDATLVIVGGGPELPRLAEWARTSRHASSIHLVGARSDVDAFYRAADVVVAPSRTETFGNVVAEAMAHGLAVVTARVGLAAHWLRHAESAVLIDGKDPAELASALAGVLADDALRARLGAAARREASASFSPDLVVDQYVALYQRLAAGLPAAPLDS
jgi:glycosyltransferase involved in cell wall biosynthesis